MKTVSNIEPYLKKLTQNKHSSRLKLLAAWDGLTIETQIKILDIVSGPLPHELKLKALSSPNAYIRYLVAKNFCSFGREEDDPDKELVKKISADQNVIVKFTKFQSQKVHVWESNESGRSVSVLKPENFFSMSKEEQIFYFSELSVRDGDDIAEIIEWGLKHNAIEQDHLDNLIIECCSNFKKFKPFTNDYDYYGIKGLEALWRLVSKLGENKAARWLIWYLPSHIMGHDIPKDVLESLSEKLLIALLNRINVLLREFRREIVFSENEKYSKELKIAAASANFDITDEDITNILAGKNTEVLEVIVESFKNDEYGNCCLLSPIYTHALLDFHFNRDGRDEGDIHLSSMEFIRYFNVITQFDDNEKEKNKTIKHQLYKLALYEIARSVTRHDKRSVDILFESLPKKLFFLKKKVIPGNAWETYKAFKNSIWDLEEFEHQLLSIEYIKSDFSFSHLPDASENPLSPADQKFSLMADKIDRLHEEVTKLTGIIDRMSGYFQVAKFYAGIFIVVWLVSKAINWVLK